ncbi:MAG: transcriptional repressor [Spirochaetaceae bacterium]|nr:transcriptional repressor [Spirochaetaceae bacterium]
MSNGYNTKSKNTIIEILKTNKETALCAESILEVFNQKCQKVNITTIYRNLDKLEKEKIINKFPASDSHKALYQIACHDLKNEEHLHLQCSQCGKIIHLDCEYMKKFIQHIKDYHEFDLTCDKSILFGLCQVCKNKNLNI